mmetsp:Transcript_21075/g.53561  ORF Transcript_21075/g.53561 Transcript_21075/m.53561 type:complete len:226 (-) Transcript_21075:190-867(-)
MVDVSVRRRYKHCLGAAKHWFYLIHQVPGFWVVQLVVEIAQGAGQDGAAGEAQHPLQPADVQHHHRLRQRCGQGEHEVEQEVGLADARGACDGDLCDVVQHESQHNAQQRRVRAADEQFAPHVLVIKEEAAFRELQEIALNLRLPQPSPEIGHGAVIHKCFRHHRAILARTPRPPGCSAGWCSRRCGPCGPGPFSQAQLDRLDGHARIFWHGPLPQARLELLDEQ